MSRDVVPAALERHFGPSRRARVVSTPVAFRNVVRYHKDVAKNVPLYEALGFRPLRVMEGFAILQNDAGLKLVLHEGEPHGENVTALGFTMVDNDVKAARAFVEKAGWRLLRAPDPSDEGFFYIYGDLDGNPINLVGERR
jgi:catechol 2,3-dioxygenase-like lactoylglutathione lyase family enzyme